MKMSNHPLSHDKTLYDLFNMINPNCYQAFAIQYIIENKKDEAIKCCEELLTAFEYYKWNTEGKQSGYIDQLICESNLDKWKKIAIMYIIANDAKQCKSVIEGQIETEKEETAKRLEMAKQYRDGRFNPINDFYNMFGFNSLI